MSVLDHAVTRRLRDYWVRLALRRVHYTDRGDKLDRLYLLEDPWQLGSAKEQARFEWTSRLIAEQFGRPATILEIGCGEGHQSVYLARACDRLYGIDVSPRAVRRAERRCPQAQFAAGDPFSFRLQDMPRPVDLVVACEVIYYVKDVSGFLDRLSRLGRTCLVTYYEGQAPALVPHFAGRPDCGRDLFCRDATQWHAVWWRNNNR